MESIRTIKLRWLQNALGDVTYQLTRVQFSHSVPQAWQPAINAFRCEECVRICVELAGVKRGEVDLRIEPFRVVVRGSRDVPEPDHEQGRAVQVLAMEIDYGAFERVIELPRRIVVDKAHAEQQNGLLWIHLPLQKS